MDKIARIFVKTNINFEVPSREDKLLTRESNYPQQGDKITYILLCKLVNDFLMLLNSPI